MKTTVTVLSEDSEKFEGTLMEVINKLGACVKEVPWEILHEAKFRIDVGEYSSEVIVCYEREETEAEKQGREAAALATKEVMEKRDKALLKQLLTKYGNP